MSEQEWKKKWTADIETPLEERLNRAVKKLRRLKGLKREMTYKAVINYIERMVGDE